MSDFIFSSLAQPQGELTKQIQGIYRSNPPEVQEFHGTWGSLGVSRNTYKGFDPLETQDHIFVVIGGPVLYFRNNRFLTESDPFAGTEAIYRRWLSGAIEWDQDLSGPFSVLIVDKKAGHITYVTDLMMFIPVYRFRRENALFLGTHVDALARTANQTSHRDQVSLADFILHDAVTYPYTTYRNIRQASPACIMTETPDAVLSQEVYWLPKEGNPYESIDEAAMALREALERYVGRVTENMDEVAQFISGGEDSRVLLGLIPQDLRRHAFIFLDHMNREGKIAEKAARAYGVDFHAAFRSETHYLEILEEASDLVGSGHQYHHAHTLGFHEICGLTEYPAVFGGYLSDTLLKGLYARKVRGSTRFPFLPEVFVPGETRTQPVTCPLFSDAILEEINHRRIAHMERVREIRPETAHEWFVIWPVTMRSGVPNIYTNRRLVSSYEVFLCHDVVKIGAAVPIQWKLNRRLFHKATRAYLEPSKWMLHSNGMLPYFPWYLSKPVQFFVWCWQKFAEWVGITKGNQGPWFDWNVLINSRELKELIEKYSENLDRLPLVREKNPAKSIFEDSILTKEQKLNLLQMLYQLS